MVTAVANGRGELISLRIDPEATGEDREMLQDLVVAAVNDALHKARGLMAQEVARLTGGLGLPPGLFPGGR
jgi:DNA-binding protein YbaB